MFCTLGVLAVSYIAGIKQITVQTFSAPLGMQTLYPALAKCIVLLCGEDWPANSAFVITLLVRVTHQMAREREINWSRDVHS